MDTIDTSPNLPRRGSSAVAHDSRPKSAENSDSDSDTETSPLGDTFIARYLLNIACKERSVCSSEKSAIYRTCEFCF